VEAVIKDSKETVQIDARNMTNTFYLQSSLVYWLLMWQQILIDRSVPLVVLWPAPCYLVCHISCQETWTGIYHKIL